MATSSMLIPSRHVLAQRPRTNNIRTLVRASASQPNNAGEIDSQTRNYSRLRLMGSACLAAMTFGFQGFQTPDGGYGDLRQNVSFVAGFWAWLIAQVMKVFTYRYKKGMWNFKALVDSGGMPSSHSSMCMGVTTAIAMQHGVQSALFSIALCFSLIVMYDAAGVRRHAGSQAQVLNVVVQEVMKGHPVSEKQLKEVLGHTPLQVFMGALLGITCGIYFGGRPVFA